MKMSLPGLCFRKSEHIMSLPSFLFTILIVVQQALVQILEFSNLNKQRGNGTMKLFEILLSYDERFHQERFISSLSRRHVDNDGMAYVFSLFASKKLGQFFPSSTREPKCFVFFKFQLSLLRLVKLGILIFRFHFGT